MSGIIDIHSHILPGIDDGAVDWDESRKMLAAAYQQGIRTIIATPHFSDRQKHFDFRELTEKLDREAKQIDSQFHILPGQEIMYFNSMTEYLKRGMALTLADTRFVLVEFMPDVLFQNLYQWLRKILQAGYIPVVAHVERYHSLRISANLAELSAAGCYFQLNYSSLEGTVLNSDVRWCRKLMLNHQIHFMGTDMHHYSHRTPVITKSLNWMENHLEPEYLLAVTKGNAQFLLASKNKTEGNSNGK